MILIETFIVAHMNEHLINLDHDMYSYYVWERIELRMNEDFLNEINSDGKLEALKYAIIVQLFEVSHLNNIVYVCIFVLFRNNSLNRQIIIVRKNNVVW